MKNKKIIIIIVIVFLFIISISFSIFNIGNDKILNNISIEGIDISGKTQQEALDEITEVYNKRKEQGLILEHNDFNTQISYDQINVTEKIGKAVDEAYLVGRSGNIITNNYRQKSRGNTKNTFHNSRIYTRDKQTFTKRNVLTRQNDNRIDLSQMIPSINKKEDSETNHMNKQNFTWPKYLLYLICCGKNDPKIS